MKAMAQRQTHTLSRSITLTATSKPFSLSHLQTSRCIVSIRRVSEPAQQNVLLQVCRSSPSVDFAEGARAYQLQALVSIRSGRLRVLGLRHGGGRNENANRVPRSMHSTPRDIGRGCACPSISSDCHHSSDGQRQSSALRSHRGQTEARWHSMALPKLDCKLWQSGPWGLRGASCRARRRQQL